MDRGTVLRPKGTHGPLELKHQFGVSDGGRRWGAGGGGQEMSPERGGARPSRPGMMKDVIKGESGTMAVAGVWRMSQRRPERAGSSMDAGQDSGVRKMVSRTWEVAEKWGTSQQSRV